MRLRVVAVICCLAAAATALPASGSALPNDPYWPEQAKYLDSIRLREAWARTTGADVVVAVVDSGVDLDHPDLAGRLLPGFDAVDGDDHPQDEYGHGTMLAGIIAANAGNGIGVAGIAPGAKILPVRVSNRSGVSTLTDIAEGIVWAADHRADVITLSISNTFRSPIIDAAVGHAVSRDVLVVAAVGNRGDDRPTYPAANPGVIAVAATDAAGHAASFSSHGEWIDLAAPGMSIISTALGPEPYLVGEGTSYAAPVVAGVAALARAADPGASAPAIAARLRAGARDRGPYGVDSYYGAGVVDALAAVGGEASVPDLRWERDAHEPDGVPDRASLLPSTATISPEGDVDWFAVEVTRPAALTFTVSPAPAMEGRAMDSEMAAYDPHLRLLGRSARRSPGSSESLKVQAEGPGRYLLRVSNGLGSASPGPYSVAVETGAMTPDFDRVHDKSPTSARTLVLGDFTGDHRVDVVTAGWDSPRSLVLWRFGTDGTPAARQEYSLDDVGLRSTKLAAGDVDGDGDDDVLATGPSLYLLRQVAGTLEPPVPFGPPATEVAVADLDQDGRQDIVIDSGTVLRNRGSGWETLDSRGLESLRVGDVTGDGRADVVGIACPDSCRLRVLAADGDGFTSRDYPGSQGPAAVAVTDVTGDGRSDVVLSDPGAGGLVVLPQEPTGELGPARKIPLDEPAWPAVAGDVNSDGRTDLVVSHAARSVGVLYGEPSGGMSESSHPLTGGFDPEGGAAVADVDGDGRVDVVVADDPGPTVLRQAPATTEPVLWLRDSDPAEHAASVAASVEPRLRLGREVDPARLKDAWAAMVDGRSGESVPADLTWDAALSTLVLRPRASLSEGPWLATVTDLRDTEGRRADSLVVRFTVGPLPATEPTNPTSDEFPHEVAQNPTERRSGYWMVGSDGRVYPFGDARHLGEPAGAAAVDLEPSRNGYWVLDRGGRVFRFGDAADLGDAGLERSEEATSLSATPSGRGYWVFTNRGRVLAFGDAQHFGDMAGTTLNGPVLDSVATPSGRGYYMVASDGGVFTFGDAVFSGSMGDKHLNKPVMSMAPDPDGAGYWLVASDGGVFAFDAPFHGSMGSVRLNKPVSGMVPGHAGYLMVAEDGGIFSFGDVKFHGSLGANPPPIPVVAVALMR